jgi:hypothetical protein
MKRLVAACAGLVAAACLAVGPAKAVTPLVVVGAGNAALVNFNGTTKGAVTKTKLVLVAAVTEGLAVVDVPRVITCQHPFRRPWVDAGAYTRTTIWGGKELRILQFHVKTNHGAYKAGSTYSFVEAVDRRVGGDDSICMYIPFTPSAADIAKAESPNGFIWAPPLVF